MSESDALSIRSVVPSFGQKRWWDSYWVPHCGQTFIAIGRLPALRRHVPVKVSQTGAGGQWPRGLLLLGAERLQRRRVLRVRRVELGGLVVCADRLIDLLLRYEE